MTMAEPTVGVILAGGKARRLGGGDKMLRAVGGRTMLDRIVERLAPQTVALILSANGDPSRFAGIGLPVVADDPQANLGPLAGILAALDRTATSRPDVAWVVSAPGDLPFIPTDLVVRLHAARAKAGTELACAASGGRRHAATALWPVTLRGTLRQALTVEGERGVDRFITRYSMATAVWETQPVDPFLNVNTPEDLWQAERIAAGS